MEQEILQLFTTQKKRSFSSIVKDTKKRSNLVAYHLKQLCNKGLLKKKDNTYSLGEDHQHLLPYLSEKKAPLPVILIGIGNEQKCFLPPRKKEPFLGMLGLPGGRMLVGESVEQATKRIVKEKYNIAADFSKICSIHLEHVQENAKTVHSFVLLFVEAKTDSSVNLTSVTKHKKKIIPSDYELITKNFSNSVQVPELTTKI